MINVVVVGNWTLTREGVARVLSSVNDVDVLGFADNWMELEKYINLYPVQVVIIDHDFIRHLSASDFKEVTSDFQDVNMLVLSDHHQKAGIFELIDHGFRSHVSRECAPHELIRGIYATAKAKEYFCSKMFEALFGNKLQVKGTGHTPALSQREVEIIQLISVGLSSKEIAERLFLSFHTIKTHRKNIIRKLALLSKMLPNWHC